ncbi:xanthine dehydrogenase molybdopterin binding subunit [soil metagenome]
MLVEPDLSRTLGRAEPHESAALHVSGRARYADDVPLPADAVHVALGLSRIAHGRILSIDLAAVRAAPGVIDVVTIDDIPGENNYGPSVHDDPIFTGDLVQFVGQPIFAVAAETFEQARRAVELATIDIVPLAAILDIESALEQSSFVLPTQRLRRGQPEAALVTAPRRLHGRVEVGGQDHFYLEGQVAFALPQDDGGVVVTSSNQHPTEVQFLVAHALGLDAHAVTVICRRMGGGFGGKESQPALFACVAALFATRLGRAAKLRVERDTDMIVTGKRHDFLIDYKVGFDDTGRIHGLRVMLASRCGYSADLSGPVNDRAMFHIDNAYFLEHVEIVSHRCKTHTVSNTAFRGFGGPQGMMAIEAVIDDIARTLALDPLDVRERNFYGHGERDVTPYGMQVEDNIIDELVAELAASSDYRERRAAIASWNATDPVLRRGIALTPVKVGISFTATHYNQAGALLHIYNDGSVLLNHGGTEMGQGLFTKVAQVVADELGLPLSRIRVSATDTSKVPNTSATAASSGSDLNGKAAQLAAIELRRRLSAFAAERHGVDEASIRFENLQVVCGETSVPFDELVSAAYFARVGLSTTGFYKTPKIHYDRNTLTGRPFFYFAYGAAVSEVVVDTLTGEHRLARVDILHDAGRSLNPAIDLGQIEGGFLQGVGWLTSEELRWSEDGRLLTHAPSTYKIPSAGDWPTDVSVAFFERDNVEDTVHRSKAVGEPPLMLALSVFHALRDAVAPASGPVALDAPCTPERVLHCWSARDVA